MNKFVLRQSLILFLTASIWGVAFVAQSVGLDYVEPFTFIAVRNYIGALVLIPCIMIIERLGVGENDSPKASGGEEQKKKIKDDPQILLIGGICCGICLFTASSFQQIGLKYTTVGKAGFITAMYMLLVPIFGVFMGKKLNMRICTAVAMAVVGMYFLCIGQNELYLQKGDLLELVCAVGFTFHILVIDHFSPKVNGVKLSCVQFIVCALLSTVFMFIFESPDPRLIMQAWVPVLYAGVMSSGVAYTLQIIGQKGMNPTVASIILSLESVVSVLAGWIILDQKLSAREIFGCALAFAAIVIVQLPSSKKTPEKS